ncbi:hypothetical protein TSUD_326060 [Trifolium subterraneum]|uniref:CCHC-type domain-containing protein n=1 Tax=Trifolium subterraneum TaxID=3900 RepID=A0A2Z6LI30_TRISU|nr:hypothetical protein TSUD_326060 [Trifolium subterraneum]
MAEINFEYLNLDEEEELNFVVGEDTEEQHDLNLCLVGRFVHDRPIRVNSMKACLADVWRPVKGMTVKEATQGLYLFKFFHPLDVEEVLKGGPWTFDSFTLIIHRVKIGVALQDIPIFHVNFWVQIHDVPLGMMLETYMRVKVRVDVRSPLKIEKKIKLNGGKGGVVKFRYEKLGLFCFVCGRLGHAENKCEVKYAMERDDGRRSWSNEIRAEVRHLSGRVSSRWLHEEGRNRDDMDASGNSCERGSHQIGPTQTNVAPPRESSSGPENGGVVSIIRGHTPSLRPSGVRQSSSIQDSSIEAHVVSLISNRPILAITNDNASTPQLTETPSLNERNQSWQFPGLPGLVIILSWNCRGLGGPSAIPNLKKLAWGHKPDILFLSETLSHNRHIESIRVMLGFDSCLSIDAEGRSGVEDEQWGEWRLTCYYGYPDRSRRRAAWDLLRDLGNMSSIPWCIIGDYNNLLSQADKKGIHPHPNGLCMGFRQAVRDCDLTDIPIEGHLFTWIKSRGTPHVIEERTQINHSFRFENSWLKESDLEDVVVEGWGGRENPEVVDRVTRCANKLQRWGKKKRVRFKEEIDECVRRMNDLRRNQDEDVSMYYQELLERHATLLIQEEGYWKQIAKMHWLQEGDMNTRFFHMSATARSKKKKVTKLIADNGTKAHTQEELCEVAKSYFDTLFKPRVGDHDPVLNLVQPRVTNDDNFFLNAPITKVEIQQALFQMHPDKSPGLDGFNPAFYQRFWEQCSDDIFSAASTWLERGYFPTSLNETNICLILKCDNPTSMKDLRPISLCNVLYKMISKVLANRSILDNALIATEVIHALKRKTQGRRGELALKIDISKAYDKVDWGFLRGVMTKMGFTDVWIRWVMICVSSVNYSVLMNYDRVGPISPGRGLRQGQEINLVKLEVFISRNMSHAAKEDLSRILGVKLVLGTGIYLGLSSMVGRSKKAIFSYIKDRIWKRINSWRGRALSKAGGGLGVGIIFVLCMTLGCVGVLIDGCPRLNQKVYISYLSELSHENYKAWNIAKVRNLFSKDVAERILETPLVSSVREDKVVWEEERNECYSVKSGGCLPTRSRLLERRVECTLNCPVCDDEIEDELHIFFRCAVARDSWCAAGLSSVLHNAAYQQTNAMDRIFAVCSNESSDMMPRQIGRYAFDAWNDWYSIHKLKSNSVSGTTEADLVRWEKPALGWVKCNVDVAFVFGSGRTSVGLCFRDNSGQFMAGMTQWQQAVTSSVEGEA